MGLDSSLWPRAGHRPACGLRVVASVPSAVSLLTEAHPAQVDVAPMGRATGHSAWSMCPMQMDPAGQHMERGPCLYSPSVLGLQWAPYPSRSGTRRAHYVCIPFTPNMLHAGGQGPALHDCVCLCLAAISTLGTFGWIRTLTELVRVPTRGGVGTLWPY